MKAELVIRRRIAFGDRDFAEMVVWRVPSAVPPTKHGLKYRLAYIVGGTRVLGFDNERGKGDHRHEDGEEHAYHFSSIDALLADFIDAVTRWRVKNGRA